MCPNDIAQGHSCFSGRPFHVSFAGVSSHRCPPPLANACDLSFLSCEGARGGIKTSSYYADLFCKLIQAEGKSWPPWLQLDGMSETSGYPGIKLPAPGFLGPIDRHVSSRLEAMSWCKKSIQRVLEAGLLSSEGLCQTMSGRIITTSEAFAGVGTGVVGDHFVEGAAKELIDKEADPKLGLQPIDFSCEYCIEWDAKCIKELELLPGRPAHIYTDIADVVPSSVRRQCGLDGASMPSPAHLIATLKATTSVTRIPCKVCKAPCQIRKTDLHRVSSPCQPHSTFGSRHGAADPRSKYAVIWACLCRTILYNVVLSECVPGMGDQLFQDMIGDIYLVQRFLCCPSELGWKITRPRQIVVLLSIPWISKCVAEWNLPRGLEMVWDTLDLANVFKFLFKGNATYEYSDYFIATDDEIDEEIAWALSRPSVKERHSDFGPKGKVKCREWRTARSFQDERNSPLSALTVAERCRFHTYTILFDRSGLVCDVGQNPCSRPVVSNKTGHIPTLIRGMGIMMSAQPSPQGVVRWLTLGELLEASGFPVSHEAMAVSSAWCQFSRDRVKPATRTRRSVGHQLGNAMHVNVVGGYSLVLALQLPDLGRPRPGSTSDTVDAIRGATTTEAIPTTAMARSLELPEEGRDLRSAFARASKRYKSGPSCS